MSVELAFVLAPRQNLFFRELVEALCAEVRAAGARASVHTDGDFPPPRPDLVYVLTPPHEYFTLMHGRRGPSPETYARTIFICAEQPDTSFFDENLQLAPRAGAVFDINGEAVRAFRADGISAEHLQIGWTPAWDHFDAEQERNIDVLFMGCLSERRRQALSEYAQTLSRASFGPDPVGQLAPQLADPASFAQDAPSGTCSGARGWCSTSTRARARTSSGCASYRRRPGAVVVSETSADTAPLRPGRHFLSGSLESLGLLASGCSRTRATRSRSAPRRIRRSASRSHSPRASDG